MARIVRGQVLSLKAQQFVLAARALGQSHTRIILRHLLPNLVGIVVIYLTLTIPAVILDESFLSFLGLGIQAPQASWGTLAQRWRASHQSGQKLLVAAALPRGGHVGHATRAELSRRRPPRRPRPAFATLIQRWKVCVQWRPSRLLESAEDRGRTCTFVRT